MKRRAQTQKEFEMPVQNRPGSNFSNRQSKNPEKEEEEEATATLNPTTDRTQKRHSLVENLNPSSTETHNGVPSQMWEKVKTPQMTLHCSALNKSSKLQPHHY